MSNLVSDTKSIQAALLRLCLGFSLVGVVIALHPAHAAPQDDGNTHELDLLSFQIISSHDTRMLSDEFIGYSASNGKLNGATHESRFNSAIFEDTFRLPTFENTNSIWATSIRWHLVSSNDHASLAPVFRVESDESKFEFRPIQHSARIMWRRALP